MAAYMYIKVSAPSLSVGDMTAKLSASSNPQSGLNQLDNLMLAIVGGTIDAQVDVVSSSDGTTALPASVGGSSASYNLK